MDCSIVDVFAERPLVGNQLAVVRDCPGLDTPTMQAIAREMNFSETTFVVAERDADADVRIFTPAEELPFAGHPTIGTAWVLGRHRTEYALNLAAGRVPVTFADDGIVWMEPPPVAFGATLSPTSSAALLQLPEDDLAPSYPARIATVGPRFALIGVRSLDALRRARPADGAGRSLFAFTDESYADDAGVAAAVAARPADFAARLFFEANGWREDPATGSANTAFAAYLRDLGRSGDFVVDQGVEIDRPSRLYLDVGKAIRVGGKVYPIMSGRLL